MQNHGPTVPFPALVAALLVLSTAPVSMASPSHVAPHSVGSVAAAGRSVELAQAEGTEPRELQPRYEPAEPQQKNTYNDEYIFGLTRSAAESTMHPAVKILVFPITVPLDFVLLPFEFIGGMF